MDLVDVTGAYLREPARAGRQVEGTGALEAVRAPCADESLGTLLRGWRERALLTQEQLAERAGLNVRTVRRLENNGPHPRTTSITLLAKALDLAGEEQAMLASAARGRPAFTKRDDPTPSTAIPRELPADVAAFVGRGYELTALEGYENTNTVAIVAIDGMAGAGKTALAVHAAHRLADRFPDGQLFVNLHGYTQGMAPVEPGAALARVLCTLGVPAERVPEHLDDRAALYRSVVADRRLLIVLDNAADEDQVRPLLPGGSGCQVIVTSRRRLIGLDGTRILSLDVLPVAEAIALFTRTVGLESAVQAPTDVLTEVVERCGLLPLAIRIAAAQLRAHPTWNVWHLLERLSDDRPAELRAGRHSVTAALDVSYERLSDDQRRAYRLLGLHVDTEFGVDAAAALLDSSVVQARRLLDQLLDVHLVQESAPGRYRFHDLVCDHAGHKAAAEEPEPDRRAALSRLLDHCSHAATAAIDRLCPYEAGTRAQRPPGQSRLRVVHDVKQADAHQTGTRPTRFRPP